MQRSTAALLMLAAAASVAVAPQTAHAYGTEITPSVSIFRMMEIAEKEFINGKEATRCEHMVDKAIKFGGSRINFMVTHFFIETNNDLVPDSYCWKPDGTEKCLPFTQDIIDTWTERFTECLKYAVRIGFTGIGYTPHMDASDTVSQWRNVMLINPLEKYSGFSYTDVMLKPLADAAAAIMADNITLWFASQGEMSQTVFRFPDVYERLHPYLKQVATNGNSNWAPQVRMGVSTNYNKLCGWKDCTPDEVAKPIYNLPAIQSLYNSVDFVGISGYPKYDGETISSMENAAQFFVREFKLFGIDLQKLINVDGKELIYNEFGIGGGNCNPANGCAKDLGDTPARTAEEAGYWPFFGIFGPYTRQRDPWRNYLPKTVVAGTRQYQEEWYRALSLWLLRKGGPTWRVDGVFLWNLNSWDALGIHPTSTNKEGSYKNDVIGQTVTAHNRKIRGVEKLYNPGSVPTY